MVDRLIIDEWLVKAENDFEFAQMVFAEEKEYYDHICFHFQQSAEKFLKAYIIANDLGFEQVFRLHPTANQVPRTLLKAFVRGEAPPRDGEPSLPCPNPLLQTGR